MHKINAVKARSCSFHLPKVCISTCYSAYGIAHGLCSMKMNGKQLLQMSAPVLLCTGASIEPSLNQSNAVKQVRAPACSRWWTGLGGRALMALWSLMSATEPKTALLSRLQWAGSRMRARPQG